MFIFKFCFVGRRNDLDDGHNDGGRLPSPALRWHGAGLCWHIRLHHRCECCFCSCSCSLVILFYYMFFLLLFVWLVLGVLIFYSVFFCPIFIFDRMIVLMLSGQGIDWNSASRFHDNGEVYHEIQLQFWDPWNSWGVCAWRLFLSLYSSSQALTVEETVL